MSGYESQAGQGRYELVQKSSQGFYLGSGIVFCHLLMAGVKPVRVTAAINQFDPDTAGVKPLDMVSDAGDRHPFFNTAVTVNIIVSTVTGTAFWVNDFLPPLPRAFEVGQLGTVDDYQVHLADMTAFQPRHVG